ncbi:MAG: hypothetical protein AAGE59_20720 [Cyanobacteria bacterium P01_F01_bin.86]
MPYALTPQAASCPQLSWLLLTRFIKRPLLFVALATGLLLGLLPFLSLDARAADTLAADTLAADSEITVASSVKDGTYVFGESSESGQLGVTYMVVNVQAQQLIGAFYQPSSSFDCFHGQITGNEMALTVVDSYSQTAHPYNLALATSSQVASPRGAASAFAPVGFQLVEVSELDHDILATCQAR